MKKLKDFGFKEENGELSYEISPFRNDFKLVVAFSENELSDHLYDLDTGDEFILHKINSPHGEYVASIKEELDILLRDIRSKCEIKTSKSSHIIERIAEFAKDNYGEIFDNPFSEYGYSVLRRSDNKKWYAIIMDGIPKSKLMPLEVGNVTIMNVMVDKDELDSIIDYHDYFPAYHMNKRSWVSVSLDDANDEDALLSRINRSRELANKKKGK